MKKILQVWRYEFCGIFSDAGTLLIMVVTPLIYSLFYPLPYANMLPRKIPAAVVDMDKSPLSRLLIRYISATEEIAVVPTESFSEAQTKFTDREIYGIIEVPIDFERNILRQRPTVVSLYSDGGYFMINRQLRGGVSRATGFLGAAIETKNLMMSYGFNAGAASRIRQPVQIIQIPQGNPAGSYAAYLVPSVFILILQQVTLIATSMMAGIRSREHTVRLKQAGVLASILGRTAAYLTIAMSHAAYYLIICPRFYGFRAAGDVFTLVVFVAPYLLSVIFLGLFLSTFWKDRESAMIIIVFSSLIFLFLSGFSWPRDTFPPALNFISLLVPTTAGINGLLLINQLSAKLNDVMGYWLVLCALCPFYFALACWRERYCRQCSGH